MATSLPNGKAQILEWIKRNFKRGDTCLDVGAGSGTYAKLLDGYLEIDGCEIFWENIRGNELWKIYHEIFLGDIANFDYFWFDLIIFGDVLEHMEVVKAQAVIEYAVPRCKDLIVAVPYRWPQGPVGGNEYERHVQYDLTPELMAKRYPKLELLFNAGTNYAYYHKRAGY